MERTTFKQKIILILFGLFLGLVLLEFGLRAGGFILTAIQERANLRSLQEKGEYVIMCIGESTTALGGESAYPRQLDEVLNEIDIDINFAVINKGVPGTDSTAILSQLKENLDTYQPDMLIVMMGINDMLETLGNRVGESTGSGKAENFLSNFKVYKLAKLFRQHILYKISEMKGSSRRRREETNEVGNIIDTERTQGMLKGKNGKTYWSFIEKGRQYRRNSKYGQAEEMLVRAIKIDPGNYLAYVELGQLYRWQGRLVEAEKFCKLAVERNPNDCIAWAELGAIYSEGADQWEKAEPFYIRSFKLNPSYHFPFSQLISHYMKRGEFRKVEKICQEVVRVKPESDQGWGALALCYESQNEKELASMYFKRADEVRSGFIHQELVRNYQKLRDIVAEKGIRLVCVQYAMRPLDQLKRMLPGSDNVVFVDNERIFKEAVRRDGFAEYFVDNCAGDFGHCSRKGNRLLAENIADTILKKVFEYDR